MKRLLFVLFCFPVVAMAQNKQLVIEGTAPDQYLTHTVGPKENYYSIGRIYNVSPRDMAPYNNLQMENGLTPGQKLKIPLVASNFHQTGDVAADEVLVPLYYTVGEKEGLYRVSVSNQKLPLETIRAWNNLSSDAVKSGTNLIVGWLKVKKDLSSLAGMARTVPASPGTAVTAAAPVSKETTPVVNTPPETVPAEKTTPVPTAKKEPPVTQPTKTAVPVTVATPLRTASGSFNGGAFKTDFERGMRDRDVAGETGEAAVFKSNSGWQDGKYYCLHNTTTPGTIVKVTNNATGKSIYAKVLDIMPDIKQNNGLLVRISNSAAQELGAGETKFSCTLSYAK